MAAILMPVTSFISANVSVGCVRIAFSILEISEATDLIMLFKAGQISMTLREWDDSTYDVTNNLVAENGRKSQKYAENVIFYRFSVPKM